MAYSHRGGRGGGGGGVRSGGLSCRVATFEYNQNSPDKITVFPDNFFYFSICERTTYITVITSNSHTHPGFLKGKSLTVIISRH